MTSKDYRLDKLAGTLTAKERALLVLRSWKTGEDEQALDFNHFIYLMNGGGGWDDRP